ncbi:MAG: hypothetical protein HWE27_14585, partial [Gammaproteobacteria bacterium]|nr:hypothetical protein [Gammaproteobacteria bacterium]
MRFYFSDAEGEQNYKTELAVTSLQAHDGRHVLAVSEGGDNVGAFGQIQQTWESLTFESANRLKGDSFRNNDEIYIRTNNGHVIKANEYDNTVDSRTHNRITWEKFTIEKLDYNSQGCLEHGSK